MPCQIGFSSFIPKIRPNRPKWNLYLGWVSAGLVRQTQHGHNRYDEWKTLPSCMSFFHIRFFCQRLHFPRFLPKSVGRKPNPRFLSSKSHTLTSFLSKPLQRILSWAMSFFRSVSKLSKLRSRLVSNRAPISSFLLSEDFSISCRKQKIWIWLRISAFKTTKQGEWFFFSFFVPC